MRSHRRPAAVIGGLSLVLGGLSAVALTGPAAANPAGTGLVISEVYGGGGNAGATYTNDFIELYNPTGAAIDVGGWSVEYFSSSGTSQDTTPLAGTVVPGGHYLVQEAQGSGGTTPLPDPDATGTIGLSGSKGSVGLNGANGDVIDLVGYGSAALCEGACAPTLGNDTSASRDADGADTNDNATDFTEGEPTPAACGDACAPPPPTVTDATIAEIQGDGSSSPLAGEHVRTRGVVTAAYPEGGLYSFVIQTEGTGAGTDATPGASDGLWVVRECCGFDDEIQLGAFVEVVGTVQEENGRTQLSYDPDNDELSELTALDESYDPVTPLVTDYPATAGEREAHEGELLDLSGQEFTVSNNYGTNQYGEIGLATGDKPLISPTEVANPNFDQAGFQAAQDDNFARGVVLDDGSSWDYVRGSAFVKSHPLPWIDQETTARVNAAATVTGPVVLDYGFGDWRLQPQTQVNGPQPGIITFEETREENLQPQDVGGDLRIATFNVLNYFNTTGMEWVDSGRGTCTYYTDRAGDEVTDNRCEPDGPRGAAEDEDLARQQTKIVAAINDLGASVVSLEEIENSAALGEDNRDDALAELTDALNAAAGSQRWAYVPSPPADERPASEDVIRTAFIYDPSVVELVGDSVILDAPAFANARQPLAQAFTPVGTTHTAADEFAVIANHFKSKGSACEGEPEGPQGNCNQSRIAQAQALASFADAFSADRGLDKVFLTGDFNAYSEEDPMLVLERNGFTNLQSDTPHEWSYSFDGQSGSLDHVLANDAALADVTGVDIWEINANEAVAFEYSRHNYNVTDFYQQNVFRASDHNPEVVGVDTRDASDVQLSLSPSRIKQKKQTSTATVTVTGADHEATGVVRFLVDGEQVARRSLLDGTASIVLGPFGNGTYTVAVEYAGDDDNLSGSDQAQLVVGNGKNKAKGNGKGNRNGQRNR